VTTGDKHSLRVLVNGYYYTTSKRHHTLGSPPFRMHITMARVKKRECDNNNSDRYALIVYLVLHVVAVHRHTAT
jgi:hypothetical protein